MVFCQILQKANREILELNLKPSAMFLRGGRQNRGTTAGLTRVNRDSRRCVEGTSYTSLLMFGTEARDALGRVNRCLEGKKNK